MNNCSIPRNKHKQYFVRWVVSASYLFPPRLFCVVSEESREKIKWSWHNFTMVRNSIYQPVKIGRINFYFSIKKTLRSVQCTQSIRTRIRIKVLLSAILRLKKFGPKGNYHKLVIAVLVNEHNSTCNLTKIAHTFCVEIPMKIYQFTRIETTIWSESFRVG